MKQRRRAGWLALVVGALLIAVAWAGSLSLYFAHGRALSQEAGERERLEGEGPRVQVVQVRTTPLARRVELPGDAQPFASTSLYAKVSGYLREILVDKGDRVRAGQLLGRIESPETDQQVRGARATFRVNRLVARRERALYLRHLVARQDLDVAVANERTARAALEQALALQGYEDLRAPFDGRVTMRYVDPGALLQAATGSAAGAQPLVDVQRDDVLRIYVYLGQDDAAFVRVGDPAELWTDARPDRLLRASVTRLAGALDPRTRTMLCEVDLDNRAPQVVPGTYLHVRLHFHAVALPIVPDEALVAHGSRLEVAVVSEGRVHYQSVRVGEDDGRETQIESGVQPGQWVALNVGLGLRDGQRIRPLAPPVRAQGRPAPR
ncbi:MAG TPA: efflux RND transporter periplasmic adaptor subunit [Myxococcales bacterium]|nr:efflux RND transporter periplasmic adaptor subunit [Myxococcales bacterium]